MSASVFSSEATNKLFSPLSFFALPRPLSDHGKGLFKAKAEDVFQRKIKQRNSRHTHRFEMHSDY